LLAAAAMKGKSMFGQQELSNRKTAPAHGFGSSTRSHMTKTFMGPEHAKTYNFGANTPGPQYQSQDSCGMQSDSGKNSPPQWNFGTADRFRDLSRFGAMAPGPGSYNNASSIGKQDLSHRSSFPHYGFGTVDRDMAGKVFISSQHSDASYGQTSPGPAAMYSNKSQLAGPRYGFGTDGRWKRIQRNHNDSRELPGPGSYTHATMLGSQTSSRLTTEPAFGFGSSDREHSARCFVSDLHSKSSGGAFGASPGPGVYSPVSSIGAQATSRGKSAPSWGFGKANRFKANFADNGTPGPGAYAI